MIIKPRIRGFVCITAHPEGCAQHVRDQIAVVRGNGPIKDGPKKVLVLGASTGYGLSTRIVSAFGSDAATLGVFFERPAGNGKPASAGWYNSVAFEEEAKKEGLYAKSINGDAFSDEVKQQVIETIKADLGQVDLVIYSLAAPRRTDPVTGETYRSTLKPIGKPFTANNLDTDKKQIQPVTIEPATEEEIEGTVKVMGGEDWERWMQQLEAAGVLADGCTSIAYDYIGPEVTWPVYHEGTIGAAKQHLRDTAQRIDAQLKVNRGRAFISVNKAVVTQASSAIPVVPLYVSILFKVMKEKGTHEDTIEQIDRLFRTQAYNGAALDFDDEGRVRMDDWEMREEVQQAVREIWPHVTTETIDTHTDFAGYQENFLRLFGFGLKGVDYDAEVEPERDFPA
ncbi:MAG: trans-2-enoyl-CoA reductase family protein [Verrucomicrobiota bacterium JB022]|nr:trans-2-enoyl-CoA reductase family protein [Verrucomicrobiota bacterium JB022]